MRHRRPISVWPALADLMTIMAVVGLFLALSMLPALKDKGELLEQLAAARRRVAGLEGALHDVEQDRQEDRKRWAEERGEYEDKLQEAARNEEMFSAIQEAQRIVDEISADRALHFARDQTLQFGDDLVSFDPNRYDPQWRPAGKRKLRRFCRELQSRLSRDGPRDADLHDLFLIHVEGHTDDTNCPGDPNCNWWLSGLRAAEFMRLMRDDDNCPGGDELQLRPIGYADSKPYIASPGEPAKATRRIALRIIPDYRKILSSDPGLKVHIQDPGRRNR